MAALPPRPVNWTPRQRQVLDLLVRRYTNAQIAKELGVSLDGAKWHVREILGILGVESRDEAADYWRQANGLPHRLWRLAGLAHFGSRLRWLTMAAGVAGATLALVVVIVVAREMGEAGGPPAETGMETRTSLPTQQVLSTAPPTVQSATPAPTPRNADPTLDAVVRAVETRDTPAFAALLRGTPIPCDDDQGTTLPDCSGFSQGSLVSAVFSFQCQSGWVPIPVLQSQPTLVYGSYELWAIAYGGPMVGSGSQAQAVEAWAVFRGRDPSLPGRMAVAITSGGIVGFGLSCADDRQFEDRYAGPTSQFIVPPVSRN